MQFYRYIPLGYQRLVLTSSPATITVPAGATCALISADGAGIRWRDDGTTPTATLGMLMGSGGSPLEYWGPLSSIQVITAGAGSPVVCVSYYRTTAP